MSEKLKTRPVVLEIVGEVAFAQHTLPPGRYMGEQRTPGIRTGGGVKWSEPTYTLKLTAQELDVLGLGLSTMLAYAAQDVTAAVRAGKMVIHLWHVRNVGRQRTCQAKEQRHLRSLPCALVHSTGLFTAGRSELY